MSSRTLLTAFLVALLVLTGCSQTEPESSLPAGTVVPSANSAETSPAIHGSLPSLEFVDIASLPETEAPDEEPYVGAHLKAGAYRSFLSGSHVRSMQWVWYPTQQEGAVRLQLDDEGTKVLADWTKSHIGIAVPIAIDGTVIASPIVSEPIESGPLEISARDFETLRSQIASAFAPLP